MTISRTNLSGNRVLLSEGDKQYVADATEYNDLVAERDILHARNEFDDSVEEFFAPISEALDKLNEAGKPKLPRDPYTYRVVQEETKGAASQARIIHAYAKDTTILMLVDDHKEDRLVWVGDSLEVLEYTPEAAASDEKEILLDQLDGLFSTFWIDVDKPEPDYGPRPDGCCGTCPPIGGGGYDCTCVDNPRCEANQETSDNEPTPEG